MSNSETSTLVDVVDPQQADLSWRKIGEQPAGVIATGLRNCALGEARDGQAAFVWRLRVIAHTRALYCKVQLPRSHAEHIGSDEWVVAVKEFGNITYAHRIIQRRLAEPWQMRQIIEKVAEMERVSAERHRPCDYPRIGQMIGWFPDPRGVARQRKPARVGALEAQIEELNGTIESLHAELSDARRQQQWWAMVVIAQQVEIERLRGVEVKDDTRPRRGLDGLDMDKVSEAWDAELKRRGL